MVDPASFERENVRRTLHEVAKAFDEVQEKIATGEIEPVEAMGGVYVEDIILMLEVEKIKSTTMAYFKVIKASMPEKENTSA